MTKVRVSPSRIFGECPAAHKMGDEIIIDGTVVHAVKGPICHVAMSAFTAQVTQIQRHERVTSHLSCPGCCFNSNQENRVIFVLGSEDAWSLSKKFSKYNWARIDGRATETSKHYSNLYWKLTQEDDYDEAEQAIDQDIKHLKPTSDIENKK